MNSSSTTPPPDANPGTDYQKALDEGWLPIREVARLTGVNAITLRAWERRYGLVVPMRTPKGHRLFSREHVQRIHDVLTWLNRGVAVSQVKALLDNTQAVAPVVENDWQLFRQNLLQAISRLSERQVDDVFNQAMALYPPRTLCEQLLMPLLADLEQRWQGLFGAQMERSFFYSWLRSKFGARIYHNNRQVRGAPVLLVNQSDLPFEPHLWLAAWLISSADCPVEVFDWPLPAAELSLACEHLQARTVLLYSSQTDNFKHLVKLLNNLRCPILIAGPTVSIHNTLLSGITREFANVYLAENALTAHQVLLERGLI